MSKTEDLISKVQRLFENSEVKLVAGFAASFLPNSSAIEGAFSSYAAEVKEKKFRRLFDNINSGDIILSETDIYNEDFLYAFYATLNYVNRTRSNDKVDRFAEIFKAAYGKKIDYTEFEDYSKILDELSDREFSILCLKYHYERETPVIQASKDRQKVSKHWEQFKSDAMKQFNLNKSELNSMLKRIERTGCYERFVGFSDDDGDNIGQTSALFRKLISIVQQ